ncbi:response regulator transcription factor [Actinoplanes sp. NPDC051851]|uniref:response regulator transcription factor n=1 Tax=Actinoplanes sp. NPDC051851 TaxID=3154753 RepID=UPI003446FDAD
MSARVLVVDDHPMWREALSRDLIEAGYVVVAAVGEGAQAARIAPATRPEVVIFDLGLPDLPGPVAIGGLLAVLPTARVLVLSASGDPAGMLAAIRAGAHGYLLKSASRAEFLAAVAAVAAGEPAFAPGLASLVLGDYRRVTTEPAGELGRLTGREREIVRLVATGRSYREIAAELSVSHRTVQNHVQNILHKLHLANRTELTRYAVQHGWST